MKDNNREQLEAIDYFVKKLPDIERTLLYRRIAYRLVDQFKLDSDAYSNIIKNLGVINKPDEERTVPSNT